jgi:hypothetical protein
MSNLNISFDFSLYNKSSESDPEFDNGIVTFTRDDLSGDRLILSVQISGLSLGSEYKLEFFLTNSEDEIFQPKIQTFFASGNAQKFSTIAVLVPKRTYILKATVNPLSSSTSGATEIFTLLYDIESLEEAESGIRNTGEYIVLKDKPIKIINNPDECYSQVPIGAFINNAIKGKNYTYTFSSCEHNGSNAIIFEPKSGSIIAGNSSQNISTIAKFAGDTNVFCLKLDVASEDSNFSDYLLIQCRECSNE